MLGRYSSVIVLPVRFSLTFTAELWGIRRNPLLFHCRKVVLMSDCKDRMMSAICPENLLKKAVSLPWDTDLFNLYDSYVDSHYLRLGDMVKMCRVPQYTVCISSIEMLCVTS